MTETTSAAYVIKSRYGRQEQILCGGRWRSAQRIENLDRADTFPSHGAAFNAIARMGLTGAARPEFRPVARVAKESAR